MEEKVVDRRVRKTKRQLRLALMKLMSEKSVKDISVRELAAIADINRGTFYIHYKDVYDLLSSLEDELADGLAVVCRRHNAKDSEGKTYPYLMELYQYIEQNSDLCHVLLGNNGDIAFTDRICHILRDEFLYDFLAYYYPNDPEMLDYFCSFIVSGNMSLALTWIDNGMKQTPEEMAVLAGDALLTLAFEVIARQKHTDPATLLRVVQEISTAAGMNGMVGGQAIDLESEGKEIPMERLREMHMGKTGALFRAAVRSGAILAGATDDQLAALTKYADAFGLTFQITDDILDVVGDEATIGKPVGSDERNHKSTYVTLLSLEKAQALAKETVDDAIAALASFGPEADFLRDLVQMLIERKK